MVIITSRITAKPSPEFNQINTNPIQNGFTLFPIKNMVNPFTKLTYSKVKDIYIALSRR